jgi:AcrR family transcriptional regulator
MERRRRDPSTERGEIRREKILRTSLRLFAEQGVEGTGLRQIAQEVGIAQPALYHYFPSKAALVDGVIEWQAKVVSTRFEQRLQASSRRLSLRQGLLDYLETLHHGLADADSVSIHRVMLAEFARQSPIAEQLRASFIAPQMEGLERLFGELAAAGKIRDLDPALLALQFIGPLLFAMLAGTASPVTMQQLAFQHLEVFIRGVESH